MAYYQITFSAAELQSLKVALATYSVSLEAQEKAARLDKDARLLALTHDRQSARDSAADKVHKIV